MELRSRLKAALTPAEWAEASRSTQYAHYTSKAVVQSMWKAMDRMGFKGGHILEPGAWCRYRRLCRSHAVVEACQFQLHRY